MALDITSIPNAKNSQIWVMSALGIAIGLAMFGFYTYRACRKETADHPLCTNSTGVLSIRNPLGYRMSTDCLTPKAYTIKQNLDLYLPEKDGTTTTTSLDSCARVAVESRAFSQVIRSQQLDTSRSSGRKTT
ncbi:hypothetical protein FG05_11325 [Fusarium graminearum]|nr:hypothetical protein FG05_11325 [Fusarium graminearum]